MRQNALLRSGRGLGLSSAARRKTAPVAIVPAVPADERDDHFAVRNGVRCAGVHLIVDLHGARGLDDIDLIEATLRRCVDAARATLLHIHLHHFQPNGVSGVAVLAAGGCRVHIAIPADGSARPLCCGRTFLSIGRVEKAREEAGRVLAAVAPYLDMGAPVIGLEPSCLYSFRDEVPAFLPGEKAARLATHSAERR